MKTSDRLFLKLHRFVHTSGTILEILGFVFGIIFFVTLFIRIIFFNN